ncbi:MAG: hypothetical protein AAF726_23605, partial [Planctomycetota bacterium]
HGERGIDEARDAAARLGAERDLRLERGGLDEGEEGLGIVEATAVGRGIVVEDPAIAEDALDPALGFALDPGELVAPERRGWMEARASRRPVDDVRAVEEQRMP